MGTSQFTVEAVITWIIVGVGRHADGNLERILGRRADGFGRHFFFDNVTRRSEIQLPNSAIAISFLIIVVCLMQLWPR